MDASLLIRGNQSLGDVNLLPVDGAMSMSQPLPVLEHVELFRTFECESLLDRLPELGRETAMEILIRIYSYAT